MSNASSSLFGSISQSIRQRYEGEQLAPRNRRRTAMVAASALALGIVAALMLWRGDIGSAFRSHSVSALAISGSVLCGLSVIGGVMTVLLECRTRQQLRAAYANLQGEYPESEGGRHESVELIKNGDAGRFSDRDSDSVDSWGNHPRDGSDELPIAYTPV